MSNQFPLDPDFKTPGQLIESLLDARGWTKRVLGVILGIDESTINKIIAAKRDVDAKLALALSDIFSVPAEQFLDLQKSWDLTQARLLSRPDPKRTTRAHLFGELPVAEMIKRGWLGADDVRNVPMVEAALAKFFKADSLEEIEVLPYAAKKTNVTGGATPVQIAWLCRVKEIADEMLVCKFSIKAAQDAVNKLKELLAAPSEARKVPRILAECGIRFVIVEALPGSKIDGVCFWLNESSPVIALSMRFDRIDNFWFVLRHEIEHVLLMHGLEAAMLDTALEGDNAGVGANIPEQERLANQAAAEFCVPQRSLESFIQRKSPLFSERDIVGFSRTMHVHPGLVAGQLQQRTERYDRFRTYLVKIRSIVAPGAMVDGWGDVAPVGI